MGINKHLLLVALSIAAVGVVYVVVFPTAVWEPVNSSLSSRLSRVPQGAELSGGYSSFRAREPTFYALERKAIGGFDSLTSYYEQIPPYASSDPFGRENGWREPILVEAREPQERWPAGRPNYIIKPVVAAAPTETGQELIERLARLYPRQSSLTGPRPKAPHVVSNEFGWPRLV